jgi:hypothetical protein
MKSPAPILNAIVSNDQKTCDLLRLIQYLPILLHTEWVTRTHNNPLSTFSRPSQQLKHETLHQLTFYNDSTSSTVSKQCLQRRFHSPELDPVTKSKCFNRITELISPQWGYIGYSWVPIPRASSHHAYYNQLGQCTFDCVHFSPLLIKCYEENLHVFDFMSCHVFSMMLSSDLSFLFGSMAHIWFIKEHHEILRKAIFHVPLRYMGHIQLVGRN